MSRRMLGEYASVAMLLDAIASLRGKGYTRLEVYTPFPLHEVDEALGARRSRLAGAVFVAGIGGAAGAYGLQWLLNAYLYPLDVGGRPAHFPLAYVPITFEMGVLAAASVAFVSVLALGRLLRLWQPIFEVEHIESATRDGFWLEVAGADEKFDAERTAEDFRSTGAAHVTLLEEVGR